MNVNEMTPFNSNITNKTNNYNAHKEASIKLPHIANRRDFNDIDKHHAGFLQQPSFRDGKNLPESERLLRGNSRLNFDKKSETLTKVFLPLKSITRASSIVADDTISLSFQLMTRAEPIDVVIATIESLLTIKSANDEILIIDNNHTQKELYEPLAAYCAGLDRRLKVRFYHVDKVAGFKSGALNLALSLMDIKCSHIVVVDSDYQALPQARIAITKALEQYPEQALLQFPQFYRDAAHIDVHTELNHYFNYHLYRPFNRTRALSTGTYAIIRRDKLVALGGWSGASITEDAQMGVLMHKSGLSTRFIPEVIATGLLPTTFPDLLSQRQRWIYGNMQVFTSYFSMPIASPNSKNTSSIECKLPFFERLAYVRAHLSQLSAWVNFTGLFIALQLATLVIIASAYLLDANLDMFLLLTPLYLVYASYAVFLGRRLWAYCCDHAPLKRNFAAAENVETTNENSHSQSLKKQLRAWLLHLNFWELGALSWLPAFWGRDKPFVCTPKQQLSSTSRSTLIANIIALPKLLLIMNLITALIVAPFSPLYSPLLFIAASSVCIIKVLAAKVMLTNYAYKAVDAKIISFEDAQYKKSSLKLTNAVTVKQKAIPNRFVDNEAANS